MCIRDRNIDDVVNEMLDYQVDGVIAASVAMSSDLASSCNAAGVPVVLFNRDQDDERLSAVTSDNITGGQKVAKFLIAGDHKRLGYIAGWEGASTQRDREAGFIAELKKHGKTLFARELGNFNTSETRKAARKMFTAKEIPDAVFVANDHMAFIVMDVMESARIAEEKGKDIIHMEVGQPGTPAPKNAKDYITNEINKNKNN